MARPAVIRHVAGCCQAGVAVPQLWAAIVDVACLMGAATAVAILLVAAAILPVAAATIWDLVVKKVYWVTDLSSNPTIALMTSLVP